MQLEKWSYTVKSSESHLENDLSLMNVTKCFEKGKEKFLLRNEFLNSRRNLIGKDLNVPITLNTLISFLLGETVTCKTNIRTCKFTPFSAMKSWTLSLNVINQSVTPIVVSWAFGPLLSKSPYIPFLMRKVSGS